MKKSKHDYDNAPFELAVILAAVNRDFDVDNVDLFQLSLDLTKLTEKQRQLFERRTLPLLQAEREKIATLSDEQCESPRVESILKNVVIAFGNS